MQDGQIRRWATVHENLTKVGHQLPHTVREWHARVQEWCPQVVITDFEPLAAVYAREARSPLIAIDNINMLDRCRHDAKIIEGARSDFHVAKAVTAAMVNGANEYVVTTFFHPPVSDLRFNWVCGRLAKLDGDELRDLIVDAWRRVVPKRVYAAWHQGVL